MRHQPEPDHVECCCVNTLCNLHWQPPKSFLYSSVCSSYELYWLPADPTSGCPVDERNPRAAMIGAVVGEVPQPLKEKGVPLTLWESMTREMLYDAPPTTVYFGLMVVPICCAFPCFIANCFRLYSWNHFMAKTVDRYQTSFSKYGISLEWHSVWLPENLDDRLDVVDEKYQKRDSCRMDRNGGPTLRFIWKED